MLARNKNKLESTSQSSIILQPKMPEVGFGLTGNGRQVFDMTAYVIIIEWARVPLKQFVSPAHSFLPTLLSSLPRVRGLNLQLSQLIGTYITVSIHFIIYASDV